MPPNNKYKELNINKIAFFFLNMEVYTTATCSSKFLIFQLKLKFDENLIQLNRVQQTTANWRILSSFYFVKKRYRYPSEKL